MERRHQVLGFLGGLSLGLGIALLLFVYGVLPMTLLWLVVIVLGMAILGWIFARVIPAREPSSDDPVDRQPPTTPLDLPSAREPQ